MNYYPYNSRSKLYRSELGAVASNTPLTLRLLLHKDACVFSAFLCIKKDGEELMEYRLNEKNYLDDYRFYEYTLSFTEGIYWYYFRYESSFGNYFISKQEDGNGTFSTEMGDVFQLTVYDDDYKTPDSFKGGIIYQIFPDRFYNSGKKKKNVPDDRALRNDWGGMPYYEQNKTPNTLGNDYFGGDLKGIETKLPYLKSLGVTAIYLNPIFEAHSNHRYNVADYLKIDPLLGDEKDFVSLCKTAHKNEIMIILDGVFSHTGDDSVYFNKYGRYDNVGAVNTDSPYRNWYKFDNSEVGYSSWWGIDTLPETNEENEDFLNFICGDGGVLEHWLNLGADGWRLDVADELPDVFLDRLRQKVKSVNENAIIIGEVWEDATNKISYGNLRRYLLGHQLDSVMNYPFSNGIINYIKTGDSKSLYKTVSDICENYPKPALNLLMNHLGTHDTARILNVLSENDALNKPRNEQAKAKLSEKEKQLAIKRLKAAAVLEYTLPGIPSLFYGDEAETYGFADPFCRACYPWEKENKELLEFYQALGKLRLDLEALKSGEFESFYINGGIFSFVRKSDSGTVLVAVNTNGEKEDFYLPHDFKLRFGNAELKTEYSYLIAEKRSD